MRRVLDVAIGGLAGVVLAPAAAVAAILIRVTMGSPILFRQKRIGKDGVPFEILKFRTMRHEVPDDDRSDRDRVTPLGSLLRSSGLDEYPQIWNILRGDMGVIGPRPTLPDQVERYSSREHGRHRIRPGLTGWAQVNGRNAISWPERIELDLWYIENRSMALDLRILRLTALRVLAPQDLYGEDGVNPDYPGGEQRSTVDR